MSGGALAEGAAMSGATLVQEVTGLHPVPVWAIATPTMVEEIQKALQRTDVPVSVGAGISAWEARRPAPEVCISTCAG